MEKNNHNKLMAGFIMVICGFVMILITSLNYLFHWKMGLPPAVMGIVFLAVGMSWIKKVRNSK